MHGEGDAGFVAMLVGIARERGVSGRIGEGANLWPAVHRLDAARLFRLALEVAPAGSVLHGAAAEGVPVRDTAAVIGRALDLPLAAMAPEAAAQHFGFLSAFLRFDVRASAARTRALLGWEPSHPTLIEDLDAGRYTRGAVAPAQG